MLIDVIFYFCFICLYKKFENELKRQLGKVIKDVLDIYFFHALYRLSPDWKEWTYCQGAIRAEQSVLEKLQLLLDTHERKHFNYYRCLQKPPSLHTYLLESFKKGRKIPIYLYYNILIEYAVRHIDEIWITFESQK